MNLSPALLFCGLLLGLCGASRAQSAPEIAPPQPHTETATEPLAGLEFKLVSASGQTSFMIGETINLELRFSNQGQQRLYLNQFYRAPLTLVPMAEFEVEPKTGTRDPLVGWPAPNSLIIGGYVPPPVLLKQKPTVNSFALNSYIRFESPGTYTISAKTSRVFVQAQGQKPPAGLRMFDPESTPVISTRLTIQITPANPQWQAEQIAAWRALWATKQAADNGWITPESAMIPQGDLRFFDTREAALAIIERLGQDPYDNSSMSEFYSWRQGLLSFSDRLWLIGAIKEAISRPDYPATQGTLSLLAELQSLYHLAPVNGRADHQLFEDGAARATRQNWNLTYESLGAKGARARAISLHSLLRLAWHGKPALAQSPEIRIRLPRLEAQVPEIFDDLPPLAQQYLIDDRFDSTPWPRIKSPRFAPVLARLWDEMPAASNGSYRPFPDAILHRLYEVDPVAGRAAITREMATARPRATFAALGLLADKTLPALQEKWWQHLNQNGADQDTAALLIGRYADAALKARVQTEFRQRQSSKMLSTDTNKGLRQYLNRIG